MADDSQEVADIIDGLGEAPAPLDVYNATRDYDTRYLASAGAAAAAAGGGGGSQPVGCVLVPVANIDLAATNPAYYVWDPDGILDNPYDANSIPDLPDGIGIDPDSLGTDTLVTTEAGLWAFTTDALGIPSDVTFTGQITFGNMNICPVFNVQLKATGAAQILNPVSVVNLSSGAGFSIGVTATDVPTANPFNCTLSGLIVVRLA